MRLNLFARADRDVVEPSDLLRAILREGRSVPVRLLRNAFFDQVARAEKAMQAAKDSGEINFHDLVADTEVAKVSVIGVGMKNHSGVASKMFAALAAENINIMMISTSEIRISCIIEEKYTELAVRVLHSAFGLDKNGQSG